MLNFETEGYELLNNVLHNQKKERSGNTDYSCISVLT